MRPHTVVVILAATVSAAAAAAVRPKNVDELNRLYAPLLCASAGECACPQAGTPACAKCPFDHGSQWQDENVCFCEGLVAGAGVECSAGRQFSPIKVTGLVPGEELGRLQNIDELKRQYAPVTCGKTEECTCPQAGTPVCGKCPYDNGSQWEDKNVCICKDLDTDAGVECSVGRQYSPLKAEGAGDNKAGTGSEELEKKKVETKNVDDGNRLYSPIPCASTDECSCPQAGTPVCAKCPFDNGSQWKDDKVCICKDLETGSGMECSAGRQYSPKK